MQLCFPHGQKRIGHISASNKGRAVVFGSYERSLNTPSEFYNLVAVATSQNLCHFHASLSPMGEQRIGHITGSNKDRGLMFGSYERSLKALLQFYNLVSMATFSQKSLSPPYNFFPPWTQKNWSSLSF